MFSSRRKKSPYAYRDSYRRDRRNSQLLPPPKRRRRSLLGKLLGDFLSWLAFLVLISASVIGAGFYFLHTRFDEAVRTHVEARLRAGFPKHRVAVKAARRLEGQGIELRGLTVAEVSGNGAELPLVEIDELLLECNATLEDLLAGKIDARQLRLRGLHLHAEQGADSQWNLAQLWPMPKLGTRQLPVLIEHSDIQVKWAGADQQESFSVGLKALLLTPVPHPDGVSPARLWKYEGALSGPNLESLAVQGDVDLVTKQWRLGGETKGLLVTSQLAALLPVDYRPQCSDLLGGVNATVNARFQMGSATEPEAELPLTFQVEGTIAGDIHHERLPLPLTDLKASFRGNQNSLEIQDATARVEQAAVSLQCTIGGFREDAPCSIKLTANQLQVNRQLVEKLPPQMKQLWGMLAPEGRIDARVGLEFDGYRLNHTATVDCHEVSFAYYKFPYRLEGGQGRVEWRDGQLVLDQFKAFANGRPVLISGEISNPGPEFVGFVTVEADKPVPIEESLIHALPESAQRFVTQLDPRGSVTLRARFERRAGASQPLHRELTIGIEGGAVRYEPFAYPLREVKGTVVMEDGQWTIRELKGSNDSAKVTCVGGWGPDENNDLQVALDFQATDVPLSDELHNALKPETQAIWQSLRPRGTIDQVRAAVKYDGSSRQTTVDLTATKRAAEGSRSERSITVKPVWLPYQMDDVAGTIQCKDGVVELREVQGQNKDTRARLNGVIQHTAEGLWEVRLDPLHVEKLRVTNELISALPQRLSNAVTKMNVAGPVSLSGTMTMTGRAGEPQPISTLWDLDFDIEDGSVDPGVRLEHLHGGLKLVGSLDQRGLSARGRLQIDSLVFREMQFTQMQGPISLDDERLGFGMWSTRLPEEGPAEEIQARVFEGAVMKGSGEVKLSGDYPFDVEGALFNASLAVIAREATSRRPDISGRTYADIRLQGTSHGAHTFRGVGNVQLLEADIYELPLMARLLSVLTIRPPNATAFTSSDVKYRIEGDRVYLDKIIFSGDAITLDGQGDMTLDGNALNITFDTNVGRDDIRDVILRPLLKEAGKRFLQIKVSGSLADPKFEKQIAPELNNTLQTLFPNSSNANRSIMSRLPKPGEVPERVGPR